MALTERQRVMVVAALAEVCERAAEAWLAGLREPRSRANRDRYARARRLLPLIEGLVADDDTSSRRPGCAVDPAGRPRTP